MRVSRPTETVVPHHPEPEPARAEGDEHLGPQRESPLFTQLLRGLGRELDRGERLAEGAIRGGTSGANLTPHELIALQAGIYRYSEALDLVTKLVDRASQAVRTTLQNQ
jgi:hypothetical protein